MKKVFTFCLFAFALLISTQTVTAQNTDVAAQKTKELSSQLKLDSEAIAQVYEAYKTYESKAQSVKEHMTESNSDYNKTMTLLEESLQANIKKAIGSELFERYLIIAEQQKQKSIAQKGKKR